MSGSGSRPKLELGECTALDEETKEECTCTEFVDFKKTSLCGTCYHYRQNHLQPAPETKKDVQSILAGMVPSGSLSGVTLGSLSKARKQLTLTGASTSARAKAANHESNRGMRPVRDSSGKGKAKVDDICCRLRIRTDLNCGFARCKKQKRIGSLRLFLSTY